MSPEMDRQGEFVGHPGNGYPNGYPNDPRHDPRRADEVTVRISGPPQPPFGPPPGGPPPFGPPGPGWPPPGSPPPGPNRLKWVALSAAVLAVIAVAAAVVFSVRGGDKSAPVVADSDSTAESGATTGSSASSVVDLKGLEALLPPSAELLTTLGAAPTLQVHRGDSAIDGKYVADESKCSAALNPFDAAGLRGSGYTAVRYSRVRDPESKDVSTVQAVWIGGAMFQTADAAAARFDKLTATLQSCAGKTVNLKQDGDGDEDSFWVIGTPVTDSDGVVSLINTAEGGGEWRCVHAAAVRNNVIVEAVDCKNNQTADRAITLVKQMTAKIAAPQ